MLLQLNVSSALCVSVRQLSRSRSMASRLFSVLTGINVAMLCYTVLTSLNPKVGTSRGISLMTGISDLCSNMNAIICIYYSPPSFSIVADPGI